jgi:hypothetical protein
MEEDPHYQHAETGVPGGEKADQTYEFLTQ